MNPLLILLTTVLLSPTEFASTPSQVSLPKRYSQSLQLHAGWNLVSWELLFLEYGEQISMNEMLPSSATWFQDHGKLWTYLLAGRDDYYPRLGQPPNDWFWNLNHAYLMLMDASHNWLFTNHQLSTMPTFEIHPDPAWNGSYPVADPLAAGWSFVGYSPPGYTKLATVYTTWPPEDGSTNCRSYRGPFHWLYWNNTETNKPHYSAASGQQYLVIVKRDDGMVYLPYDPSYESPLFQTGEPDEIGVLEPGRGYFLGFWRPTATNNGMLTFSWDDYPGWPLNSLPSPGPKGNEPKISSASHFQFKALTQFFYPIFVDTVEVEGDTIETGDEIAVFTPAGLCVGATAYQGLFPLHLNAWQDDLSTDSVDGYIYGEEMTFKLFDQSRNQELTFTLPPGTMSVEDDQIAPTHSGFGKGLYALRNFTGSISSVQQLPQTFHLGQNYPNPFNSETIIPLELPQRSHVKIELFNVQGRSLGLIFEGIENAGWPKVHYNASRLASGMYFCRVIAEGLERSGKYQSVGKLLLLK